MRVSNITYYFPTKDDLVFEISKQLSESNSAIIIDSEKITMTEFLRMLHRVFENHYQFRCLLRSFVHIVTQNKLVGDAYKKTQVVRRATIASNIKVLSKGGYLKLEDEEDLHFLVATLSLINRFWISEASISAKHLTKEAQIRHYLKMLTKLLWPYSAQKAKKEIVTFLDSL
jgi:AcrR family transcriptional regulator